jgi:C4-dicarboxylate-specific signal transduction histidine kinase
MNLVKHDIDASKLHKEKDKELASGKYHAVSFIARIARMRSHLSNFAQERKHRNHGQAVQHEVEPTRVQTIEQVERCVTQTYHRD